VSPVHSSPDAPRPTFVPLALAIDMGQTGPIGSLTTTTIGIKPGSRAQPPSEAEPPANLHPPANLRPLAATRPDPISRRHLRLLPNP
jgi:hypothetical protein